MNSSRGKGYLSMGGMRNPTTIDDTSSSSSRGRRGGIGAKNRRNKAKASSGLSGLGMDLASDLSSIEGKKRGRKGKVQKVRGSNAAVGGGKASSSSTKGKKGKGKGKGKGKSSKVPAKTVKQKKASATALRDQIALEQGRFNFQVQISNPLNYTPEQMLGEIANAVGYSFTVINARQAKKTIFFTFPSFDSEGVERVKGLNEQFVVDGKTITISVERQIITQEAEVIPINILDSKYNSVDKVLDLYEAVQDPQFAQYLGPSGFNAPTIPNAIINIVRKNCKDVKAVDLSGNGINSLVPWAKLGNIARKLEKISFKDNNISTDKQLVHLRSCSKIKEAYFEGNPFVSRYPSRDVYEQKITKVFKKLEFLDGIAVSAALKTSASAQQTLSLLLPPEQQNAGHPDAIMLVRQFLASYFTIFDGARRSDLLAAYDSKAVFRIVISSVGKGPESLKKYIPPRCKDKSYKGERKQPLDIVQLLSKFPDDVVHESAETIGVNVLVAEEGGIQFVCAGHFQERIVVGKGGEVRLAVRLFRREITLVPNNSAKQEDVQNWPWCIRKEILHIAKQTEEVRLAEEAMLNQGAVGVASSSSNGNDGGVTDEQLALINQLCQATNLTQSYAFECLSSNSWVYDSALANFNELNANGQIPPDGFNP